GLLIEHPALSIKSHGHVLFDGPFYQVKHHPGLTRPCRASDAEPLHPALDCSEGARKRPLLVGPPCSWEFHYFTIALHSARLSMQDLIWLSRSRCMEGFGQA